MNDRIRAFYRLVTEDLALQEELNEAVAAVELSRDEAVSRRNMANVLAAFARRHGLEMTAEDFETGAEGTLSDEELAGVAGGAAPVDPVEAFLRSLQKQVCTDGLAPTDFWRP